MDDETTQLRVKMKQGTPEYDNQMLELETHRAGELALAELLMLVAYRCQGGVTLCFASPQIPTEEDPASVEIGISGSGQNVASAMLRFNQVVAETLVKFHSSDEEGA